MHKLQKLIQLSKIFNWEDEKNHEVDQEGLHFVI